MNAGPKVAIVVLATHCFAIMAGAHVDAQQRQKRPAAPALKLTLHGPPETVRPGESTALKFTLKNMQPRPLRLAINQGAGTGSDYATRTLAHRIIRIATGEPLPTGGVGGCPVGEGFRLNQFHELAGGEELRGVIEVQWAPRHMARVPHDLPRGEYRIEAQYDRPQGDDGGQFAQEEAAAAWKKTDAIHSNVAVAVIRVIDWDDDAINALRKRLATRDPAAMLIADGARLEAVFPEVEQALLDGDRLTPEQLGSGPDSSFSSSAISFLGAVPFAKSSAPLWRMIASPKLDYRLKYEAIATLGAFPADEVGPWAVAKFHEHEGDRMLQDKLLGVLIARRYETNDRAVLDYMLREVRQANPDVFRSSIAWYILDACEALGRRNTRAATEAIRDRLSDIRSPDQYTRCAERIVALLAE
jgi:hypothetical protein